MHPFKVYSKLEHVWENMGLSLYGSRFDREGKVVTGPATKGLEKVELRELINETEETK